MTTKYQQYLQRKKKIMQTFEIGTKVKFNEENLNVELLLTKQTGAEYTVEKKPFIDALKNEVYCLQYESEICKPTHVYVNVHRLTPVVPVRLDIDVPQVEKTVKVETAKIDYSAIRHTSTEIVWGLIDRQTGIIGNAFTTRKEARERKSPQETVKKVRITTTHEVIE